MSRNVGQTLAAGDRVMKHTITIDGEKHDIDIRAMDEGFIMYDKLWEAPLMQGDLPEPEPGTPAHVVQEFFRRQIRAIGSWLILVWDGDGLVGKMHFTTREMHEAIGGPENYRQGLSFCYCVDHAGFAPKLQSLDDQELTDLLASKSRTLRVLCFNIGHTDPKWHGHGIATAMVQYLKHWARDKGWQRIEARSCPDITPTSIIGDWMLRRSAWERQGFRMLEEMPVSGEEAGHRLREIEAFLSGTREHPEREPWYVENLPRFAAGSGWRSGYDKDCLMGCEL